MTTAAPIVFFDIAGPDIAAQSQFYSAVFGWTIAPNGQFIAPVPGAALNATLRADPPETLIYVGVPDVTATLKVIVDHGGKIETPRFEVKGVVVLGLFRDPAGNRMGLVELDGVRPRIP